MTPPEPAMARLKIRQADGAEGDTTVPVTRRKNAGPVVIRVPGQR